MIDKHTNLATALLREIKARHLDRLYALEEDALAGKADAAAVLKVLQVGLLRGAGWVRRLLLVDSCPGGIVCLGWQSRCVHSVAAAGGRWAGQ